MLVSINGIIEHDARYVQFQGAFRSIGNVTLERARTDVVTSRTSFCALCGQVASTDVSEHFYLRRSHTFIALFGVISFVVYVMPAQTTP